MLDAVKCKVHSCLRHAPLHICQLFVWYVSMLLGPFLHLSILRLLREIISLPSLYYRNKDQTKTVYPADVILFEGILVFYFKEIRELFNMKLFVDTDADTRLSRRGIIGY